MRNAHSGALALVLSFLHNRIENSKIYSKMPETATYLNYVTHYVNPGCAKIVAQEIT